MHRLFLALALALIGVALGGVPAAMGGRGALALPNPDEIPEEVLRTEVITEARSPLTGEPISAADYAVLQDRLRDPNRDVLLNPEIADLIQLLRLRRIFRPILPFLP